MWMIPEKLERGVFSPLIHLDGRFQTLTVLHWASGEEAYD